MLEFEPYKRPKIEDFGFLVLRLTVALPLLLAGLQKLIAPEQMVFYGNLMIDFYLPASAAYGLLLFELVAPLMLITGVLSRVAAALVIFYMLVALLLVDGANLFQMLPNAGYAKDTELMLLLGGIAICCLGSGDKALYPD